MFKILSKLQVDRDLKPKLYNVQNSITKAKIIQRAGTKSSRSSIFITPLTDYSLQRSFGLDVSFGRYFLNNDLIFDKHSFPKAKILNIPYCESYGHCLHDIIPKLMHEDLQSEYDVIYSCGSPVLTSLLELFEIKFNKVQILNKVPVEIEADEICIENCNGFHLRDKEKIRLLKNQIDNTIAKKYKPEISNRLIYCSRSGANVKHKRRMCEENEEEIIRLLKTFCNVNNLVFTFFNGQEDTQTTSHTNQLKLFSEAKIVVGPHGTAMSNIIYLNPNNNCSICEFTSGTEVVVHGSGLFVKHYCSLYGLLPGELFKYYLIPFSKGSTFSTTKIDTDNLKEFFLQAKNPGASREAFQNSKFIYPLCNCSYFPSPPCPATYAAITLSRPCCPTVFTNQTKKF